MGGSRGATVIAKKEGPKEEVTMYELRWREEGY